MCGIFGMILQDKKAYSYKDLEQSVRFLFLLSSVRGQDTAGMAILSGDEIKIFRRVKKPSLYLKDNGFCATLKEAYNTEMTQKEKVPFLMIGQCRLVTHGSCAIHENNQPIHVGSFVGVHNGIITNAYTFRDKEVAAKNNNFYSVITSESGLVPSDTKLFLKRNNAIYQEIGNFSVSVSKAFLEIEGSASVALLCDLENRLIIASNTGALYYVKDPRSGNVVFVSERRILMNFLRKSRLFNHSLIPGIKQVKAGSGVQFEHMSVDEFSFRERSASDSNEARYSAPRRFAIRDIRPAVSNLRRCRRCVLPHTYPFIEFDAQGVCNFCNRYERQKFYGSYELEKLLDKYRSQDGSADCLVGLSGGRDSSYGLHILTTKYGMHPVAYTYDWGLTTDTSRNNQARMCGRLGIEHIIRSPDIQKKRRFIRTNIYAWLKKPELGMVPIFMAGDKDFYHFGRQLRKELGVKLTVFCSGYLLEQREFFVGFCGVNENVTKTARLYHYSNIAKLKLAFYYILQYLKNPTYINESFFDSIRSFITSFIRKDDFLYLYEYLPWEEKKMEEVLKREYGWEDYSAYGPNQWRMGDGQTAFTNYIYYSIAGFTEFDNFRSNQVREGLLTRDEALKLIEIDNRPKYATLQYFSYVVGFNLDEVLAKIDAIPKLY